MNLEEEINKKATVATNSEILAIVFIFLTILFFIFPKEKIEKVVLNENINYDLSISYLKSIISKNPIKDEFKIALAQIYVKAEKKKELFDLLTQLDKEEFKDKDSFNPYYYKLYSDSNQTNKADYIVEIILSRINEYRKDDIKIVLDDLIAKNKKRVFIFANSYISIFKPNKKELDVLIPQLFYLANRNKNYKFAGVYLEELLRSDKNKWAKNALYFYQDTNQTEKIIEYVKYLNLEENSTKEQERLAYLYINERNYDKAIEYFEKLAKDNPSVYEEKLAYVYMQLKEYKKASSIFENIIQREINSNKFKYFKLAVDALMMDKKEDEVLSLLYKYEDLFLNDEESSNYVVKLYLGLNKLDGARNFSKKILKKNKE